MAYEFELKYFEEKNAARVSRNGSGLTPDTEIQRVFERSLDSMRETGAAFLRKFTSASNLESINADTAQYYVDDPRMDNVVYPGRWRQVSVQNAPFETDPNRQGVFQTLRLGYIQTLLADEAIDFTEARKAGLRTLGDQPTGENTSDREQYREIMWPNVSPFHVSSILAELTTGRTVTDPVVEGETLTGEWSLVSVGVQKADDGSAAITMSLAQPNFRLDGYSTWFTHKTEDVIYMWGIEKDQAQEIADAWKTNKGASCTFGYNKEVGLVDLVLRTRNLDESLMLSYTGSWDCRYKEIVTHHFSLDDPELYPSPTPGSGKSYRRRVVDNGDGTWDIILTEIIVQYRNFAFQTSAIAGDREVETRQQLGVTTQAVEPMDAVDGQVKTQQVNIRDDCSSDVNTDRDMGTAQEHKTYQVSAAGETNVTEKTVQTAVLATPSQEDGKIKRVMNRQSRYHSRYDTTEEIVEVEDQEGTGTDESSAQTVTRVTHTQNVAKEVEPEAVVLGQIVRVQNAPTEAGRWNTSKDTVATKDQAIEDKTSQASAAQTVKQTSHTQAEAPVEVTHTAGTIKRVSNSPTEFGRYAIVLEEAEAIDQAGTGLDDSHAQALVRNTNTQAEAKEPEAPAVPGTIVRVMNAPTDFGRWSVMKEEVTAKNQAGVGKDESYAQTVDRTTNTQSAVQATASETPGKIVRAMNNPTEFGLYATVKEEVTAKDQTGSGTDESHAQTLTRTTHTQNTAQVTAAETAGKIVRVMNSPTDFGRHATVKEEVTAKDQTGDEDMKHYFMTSAVETHTQGDEVDTTGLQTDGEIVNIRNVPTEFGKNATRKETLTSVEREWDYTARYSDTGTFEREHGKNVVLKPTITDDPGKNASLSATINEFGRWDFVKETETPRIPESCGERVTWTTYGGTYTTNRYAYSTAKKKYFLKFVYLRQVVQLHYLQYFTTAADAADAIGSGPGQGTSSGGVSRAGNHLWVASWVQRDDTVISITTLDPPWEE